MAPYLLVLTVLGFGLTVLDKHLAKHHFWRIPEPVLILTAMLGGSLGVLLAMLLFRHKTRKALFLIGVPLILVVQLSAIYFLRY